MTVTWRAARSIAALVGATALCVGTLLTPVALADDVNQVVGEESPAPVTEPMAVVFVSSAEEGATWTTNYGYLIAEMDCSGAAVDVYSISADVWEDIDDAFLAEDKWYAILYAADEDESETISVFDEGSSTMTVDFACVDADGSVLSRSTAYSITVASLGDLVEREDGLSEFQIMGFTPGSTLSVTINGEEYLVDEVIVDAGGEATAIVDFSSFDLGTYPVTVSDSAGRYYETNLEITPRGPSVTDPPAEDQDNGDTMPGLGLGIY